jgi:NADPH:quinone reductase-like Zn-dependent oxidoreductase
VKAAVYYENGPPSVLRFEEVPDPHPGPREVLVRVEAISIEGGDLISRQMYLPSQLPHIVGYQAAGTVVGAGPEVTRFKVGQRVATFHWAGSHASLRAVPEDLAWAVPDGLDIKVASTVPVTFGTADDALFEVGGLKAGETVLIHGSTGGVGIAAIQLAHAAGATVIATTSSDERIESLKRFGADHVINHKAGDLTAGVKAANGGKGADLVIDMVGGALFKALIQATRYRGRIVVVGFAGGAQSIGVMDLLQNAVAIQAVLFGREMAGERARELIERHLQAVAAGKLGMPIDRVFALSEAAAAHQHVATGHPFGRVIMAP